MAVHKLQRAPDHRQHTECQHVHLQQPEGVQVILVPLNDAAARHGGIFDRHELRQWPTRYHEPADVLRQVARESNQHIE
ncbi:hypothetical protein D3C83_152760 [compost metagenome]